MQNAEQTGMPDHPITTSFTLDNAATLRLLWPILGQAVKDELEAAGILSIATVADINAGLDWRVWTGKVAIRSYWRAYGENIAPAADMGLYQISPELVQEFSLLLMARDPNIGAMVAQANLGRPVVILPPINVPEAPVDSTLDAEE
ncbi:hypothetical protein [Fibrella forsythiae]|uniref:Uncharacterized protein n=1 Tax=Fibrella forsythiae TaxID=2817061 RepID=A0ABS3JAE8_9BACT|nr:hypothetical protein [Fibrella forsythiae]MBO0946962.1 hypothetical protein [Fibrella forsythiae]